MPTKPPGPPSALGRTAAAAPPALAATRIGALLADPLAQAADGADRAGRVARGAEEPAERLALLRQETAATPRTGSPPSGGPPRLRRRGG